MARITESPDAKRTGTIEIAVSPLDPDRTASLFDSHLRRLAGREAAGRLVLGRLAQALLRRRGQHLLGFARLSDYARERVGCSARELESLARIAERLRALPLIAAAFARGELCWTHLRDLVEVANPDDEEGWLKLIRGPGARIAEVAARRHRRGRGERDPQTIDDEPRVTVHLACPNRVRAAWLRAVDLARQLCGSDVATWQAAHAIAAEGFFARETEGSELSANDAPDRLQTSPAAAGDESPHDMQALVDDCEHLAAHALDRRLRAIMRALRRIDWQTGRLLRQLAARGLHRRLGFSTLDDYVANCLAMTQRKARALATLESRSREAPALADAYRDGQLSWLHVLTLLPVARGGATRAWIARARSVTLRRLADEVAWAMGMRDGALPGIDILPPPADASLVRKQSQIDARDPHEVADGAIVFPAPASVAILVRDAIAAFGQPVDPPWGGLERLVRYAVETWALPRNRDRVFDRDAHHRPVPASGARGTLHDHHAFRARRGDDTRNHRITVCAAHYLHGIQQDAGGRGGEHRQGFPGSSAPTLAGRRRSA